MKVLGRHLLLELIGCAAALIDDEKVVRKVLLDAARAAGATVVGEIVHKFSPVGVTAVLAIAESHFSLHTWPEHGYVAVDLYTCGEAMQPLVAAFSIASALGASAYKLCNMERGVPEDGDWSGNHYEEIKFLCDHAMHAEVS